MKILKNIPALALLAAGSLLGQYKSAPVEAMPPGVPSPLIAMLEAKGTKITKADGSTLMEIWVRNSAPSGGKNTGDGIALTSVPSGAVLALVNLTVKGEDRRGQQLKPGLYTMRYALMPVNGDHLGAAPQRDFGVLVPLADETSFSSTPDFDAVVAMSRKASGTAHPAVFSIGSGSGTAGFTKENDHDWTLNTKLGDVPVAIILLGRAE